ncbi:MAG: hypothetical protein K9N01_07120 [Cephaloticoccus sp.]|nr:hypothetical protein [Cephaloticoccus sp.]
MKAALSNTRGFALVLVLSLLAILVLLTYTIAAVSKVSGEISTAALYQTQSRQNALVALHYALGELQKYAGVDNRVTGMAGVVGVTGGDTLRQLTGVWGNPIGPRWLVSGAVNGGIPSINGNRVILVGSNTVGSTTGSEDQEMVEAGLIEVNRLPHLIGHMAYWVGDEGVKVSTVLPDTETQNSALNGQLLRPDMRRIIQKPSFDPSASELAGVLLLAQLPFTQTAKGATISSAFHLATVCNRALASTVPAGVVSGQGYIKGAFNINTTSVSVWRGLLEYPDRNNPAYGLSATSSLRNAEKITARIAARGVPFTSVADFLASGIVQDAFASTPNKITSMTAQEFITDVSPILAVRSDTFRIRAYGDALNPADSGVAGATPESVAYCEALVQRTPEDDPGGKGKKFVITYFRWLGPDDI